MSRDSLVEKYNERHDGVDYFYTTCHNNGCWDATCLIKCGIKDGKVSLSMKALEEPKEEPQEKVVIPKSEEIGTNLGDLFKNLKL